MIITPENYRGFPAVSNSDLTQMQKYWMEENQYVDIVKAYANGTLIDCLITEPSKVDHFNLTVEGEDYCYSSEEFHDAKEMKKAFLKDPFCASFVKNADFQYISYDPALKMNYDGLDFYLPCKAKWDILKKSISLGGDIKSTACTTRNQVIEAMHYFEYPRARALYCDLERIDNDVLIFISKKNYQVFKIQIKRGDELYRIGKAKYQAAMFQYWSLFNLQTA